MVDIVLFLYILPTKCLNFPFYCSLISFDELLELSQRGDNSAIDMLVGDIYGGMDYSKVFRFTCIEVFFRSAIVRILFQYLLVSCILLLRVESTPLP